MCRSVCPRESVNRNIVELNGVNRLRLQIGDKIHTPEQWFSELQSFFADIAGGPAVERDKLDYHILVLPQLDGAMIAAAIGFLSQRVEDVGKDHVGRSIRPEDLEVGMLISAVTGQAKVPFTGLVESIDLSGPRPRLTVRSRKTGTTRKSNQSRTLVVNTLSNLMVLPREELGTPTAWGSGHANPAPTGASPLQSLVDSERIMSRVLLKIRVPRTHYEAEAETVISDPETELSLSVRGLLRPVGEAGNVLCRVLNTSEDELASDDALTPQATGPQCEDVLLVSAVSLLATRSTSDGRVMALIGRDDRFYERAVDHIRDLYAYSHPLPEEPDHQVLPLGTEYIGFRVNR